MKNSLNKERGFFETLFFPHYDELTLFSMSYICILLFFVNFSSVSWGFEEISLNEESIGMLILCLVFISGLFLSLFHAFSNRKKTLIEKKLMLIFAAFLCGFGGIWGGTYMLVESPNWLIVFPLWNIVSGYMLLGGLRGGGLSEDNIGDENASFAQVALSVIIVSFVFFVTYRYLSLNWAATFSICMAWVTTFNSSLNHTLMKERIKINQV